MRWISSDGVPLQGILYKPENFDPTKKYPMISYFYEDLSDGLHSYIAPNGTQRHQPDALRVERVPRVRAGHLLRDGLSRAERGEVDRAGRAEADRSAATSIPKGTGPAGPDAGAATRART